jgi:hypothetical protein
MYIKTTSTEKKIRASLLLKFKTNSGTYLPKDEFLRITIKFSSNTRAITGITKLMPIASIKEDKTNTKSNK